MAGNAQDGREPVGPPEWLVQSEPAILVRRSLAVVRHRYPVILLVLGAITFLGFDSVRRGPTLYEARAKLLVEPAVPPIAQFRDVSQPSVPWWADDFYITQAKMIVSRAVLEKALEDEELARHFTSGSESEPRGRFWTRSLRALLRMPPPRVPEPWERLKEMVEARYVPKTQMISLRAWSTSPQLAVRIANTVADAFVEFNVERRMKLHNEAYVFLLREKDRVEHELRAAEEALQEYREEHQITPGTGEGEQNPLVRRLAALNERLTQVELERVDAETAFRVVQEAVSQGADRIDPQDEALFALKGVRDDPAVAEIRREVREVDQELASLRDIYGPQHPRMQAVMNRRRAAAERLQVVLREIVGALEKQVESLRQQEQEVRELYAGAQAEAVQMGREAQRLRFLEAEVERQRKLFEVLVQRLSEVKISSEYKGTAVTVLERPAVAHLASGADKIRKMQLYVVAGLFLGVLAAFGMERLDDRVRVPEDLRDRLGLKVLGTIPHVRAVKRAGDDPTLVAARITSVAAHSSIVEAFRSLRTTLFFTLPEERNKVIAVTSAVSGEGKSTVASNLALTLARNGKRVLLVDSDFHRPLLHRVYGVELERGLSVLLTGEAVWEECIQQSTKELDLLGRLDILPAGPMPVHGAELLDSTAMDEILQRMRREYDRVIIDTPPVLLITDTLAVAARCDSVILVVRAFGGSLSQVRRARDHLYDIGCQIAGAVLNDIKVSRFSPYYSDYYYHGHARYHDNYYSAYAKRPAVRPGRVASLQDALRGGH